MTTGYVGNIISATAPTVSPSSASGVWSLEAAQYYQKAGQWPDGSGADPYFDNTTLLLHGDGTNGAQNNTFLDSSTNNFTITRNGNTTQGSFNPYAGPGNWSDFYAPTSSGWQTPANSVTSILGSTFNSTATFTVEAWIYPVARHSGGGAVLGYVFGSMNLAGSSADWTFGPDSNGNLVTFWYQGGNQICKGNSVIPLNTWTHVALSVSAGAIKMFVNGVQETTTGPTSITLASQSLNYVSSGGYLYAGTTWQGFNGYISNMRVIGKRAAYTTTFTPSTTPLVATSDTTLLTCQQNGFTDMSAANWTLTRTGSVQVSKFSPFTLYQTTPASYSGYFDGTGDYLTFPQSALQFGTGDFTVEAWVYFSTIVTDQYIFNYASSGPTHVGINYYSGAWRIGGFNSYLITGGTVSVGQWYHVAMVRSGNSLYAYINGTQLGSAVSVSGVTFNASGIGYVAAYYSTQGNNLNGSISNLRITNGVAVYTANFTPPTSPLTAISGTSLLTCQSTTFIDNSTNALTITANGNATPRVANPFTDAVTGPTPYSTTAYGGSVYFDGTGDYLLNAAAAASNFGTSDFTWESWIYAPAWNTLANAAILYESNTTAGSFILFKDANTATPSNRLAYGVQGGTFYTILAGALVPTAQWFHLALSRTSAVTKCFVNGALVATISDTLNYSTSGITVGGRSGGTLPFNGFLSDTRIVKGTGLYSGPFVPPAAPLTAVSGTSLLIKATNAGIFDNTAVNDLETLGSAQISTSIVKYGTGSMYFNGVSGTGAKVPSTPALALGSGDWTIECWAYYASIGGAGNGTLYEQRDGTNTAVPLIYLSGSTLIYYANSAARITGGTMSTGQWYHIAVCRASGSTRMFVNGAQVGSTYADSTTYVQTPVFLGCDYLTTGNLLNGYIDNLRVTKGYARYTANFTPPSAAFPNY